ncbi:PhzF family phenazine biosynthesis protein [Halomonas mongoliensis]|uniref:PhzF family phenazine biosynthesis protein n=1 Tax=Halomonas mongoliensis TaxID=321265 RepID=A0ABU1GKG4_9GAMM|nr:PhzF family phenazine biosynthesis protein [Halomonas mongoliensis]MDR5892086.1 PhzF family phenazine biosynthesis protein [Halomonas mongoliensis]
MELDLYQVDAFARRPFEGNPAAVCPLTEWLEDATLQAIAAENNLSKTAFFVREGEGYRLRWFTPTVEVDLCGHATLASAWVIFHELGEPGDTLRFATRSGELRVGRTKEGLAMDFPAKRPEPMADPEPVLAALGVAQGEIVMTDDIVVAVEDEALVAALAPDMAKLAVLPGRGVAVTAPGREFDFVSRWFGPKVGVEEDPVTGSAHTTLAPYWAGRLGKSRMTARQGGARQGQLTCECRGDRVILTGQVAPYLRGTIRF